MTDTSPRDNPPALECKLMGCQFAQIQALKAENASLRATLAKASLKLRAVRGDMDLALEGIEAPASVLVPTWKRDGVVSMSISQARALGLLDGIEITPDATTSMENKS